MPIGLLPSVYVYVRWGCRSPGRQGRHSVPTVVCVCVCVCVCVLVAQLCPSLCDPMDYTHQAPLSRGLSRQEHQSGLPFPSSANYVVCGKIQTFLRVEAIKFYSQSLYRQIYKIQSFIFTFITVFHSFSYEFSASLSNTRNTTVASKLISLNGIP